MLGQYTAGKYTWSDTEGDRAFRAQPAQNTTHHHWLRSKQVCENKPQTQGNDLYTLMFIVTPLKISNKVGRCYEHTAQELQDFSITFLEGGLSRFHMITVTPKLILFLQGARSAFTPAKAPKLLGKISHCSTGDGQAGVLPPNLLCSFSSPHCN